MKGQGLPKIKLILIGIFILFCVVVGLFYFNDSSQPVDITHITEGQTNITAKLDELLAKVNSLRTEINQLKTNMALKSDIDNLNSRFDIIDNEIANIEPQAVQNIDLTNINTYVNNYNIRIIFSFTVALIIMELLKFGVNILRKKNDKLKREQNKEILV